MLVNQPVYHWFSFSGWRTHPFTYPTRQVVHKLFPCIWKPILENIVMFSTSSIIFLLKAFHEDEQSNTALYVVQYLHIIPSCFDWSCHESGTASRRARHYVSCWFLSTAGLGLVHACMVHAHAYNITPPILESLWSHLDCRHSWNLHAHVRGRARALTHGLTRPAFVWSGGCLIYDLPFFWSLLCRRRWNTRSDVPPLIFWI